MTSGITKAVLGVAASIVVWAGLQIWHSPDAQPQSQPTSPHQNPGLSNWPLPDGSTQHSDSGGQGVMLAGDPSGAAQRNTPGCSRFEVRGSHRAASLEEAREGSDEDVRDVCPSGVISQPHIECTVQTQTIDGEVRTLHQCAQTSICEVCGEHQARYLAANPSD